MSNSSKKKEVPLNETFYNLCKDLLRFIDRKIIKKYISPNIAQLPKEMRNHENKQDNQNQNKEWTYFYKEKEITKEEKIKDVFKDDFFLGHLQNLTNSLIIVLDYLEQNQINIKKLEEEVKNKEDKLSSLNELKNLLNSYFEKNNNVNINTGNENNTQILEDKNLINIMNKIQSLNSTASDENKITENIININDINNNVNNNVNNNINNNNNNINNNKNNNNNKKKNNNKNNNNSNNISNDNIILNIEKIIHSSKKSKTPQKSEKKPNINNIEDTENTFSKANNNNNNNNSNNYNESKTSNNQCLSAPVIDRIINNDNNKNEPNSKEKNEIDFLIDNFRIGSSNVFNSEKGEKKEERKYIQNFSFLNLNNNNNQENPKEDNNIFLHKKIEREQTKANNDEKKNNNININDNNNEKSSSENKKGKNKKKKNNNNKNTNPNPLESEKDNNNNFEKNIPLKEEEINLPILNPIEKNKEINQNKNDKPVIDEDILKILLEENDNNKNDKKGKNNKIDDVSLDVLFSIELEKHFSEIKPKDTGKNKVITDIISLIKNKTKGNKNNNQKIQGPYLVGSYKVIPNLCSFNYSTPIDIMYKYKDILLDKTNANNTVKDFINNCLNLSIIETLDNSEDKIMKIFVKCSNNKGVKIDFVFYFVNTGTERNEKIINDIVLDSEIMNFKNKDEEKKYINIILFLRIWRKKYDLLFLFPEILDEIAKNYYDPNKAIALIIFNVFYDLYNSIIDFNTNKKQVTPFKNKLLIENLIKTWFDNEENCKEIQKAVLETHSILNNKNFSILFNKSEDK